MASHQIAIAKASFSAGLLRPDPTSVPRNEITAFHAVLDQTLSHCSPANIQTCKSWLLDHVISSSNRVGVWAKYLVALSGSFSEEDAKPTDTRRRTSPKRKRLHILYLLNDLFHHTRYHLDTSVAFSTLSAALQPYIVDLIGLAASYDREKNPKHHKRLDALLDIWDANGYYASDYVGKLREVVKNSALTGPVKASTAAEEDHSEPANKIPTREVPFVMPPTHGDPSTPYYDLPAGNMVPHIIPNSKVPLHPDSIKPLQFLAGPADEKLVDAVKVFLQDVDRIYGSGKPAQKDDETIDIDELGQTVTRDGITGEIIDGETYYGWSRAFCQQMKRNGTESPRSRSRSRSLSRSRGNYRSRYSDSPDSRRFSSRSRSRSRSPPRRRGFKRRSDTHSRSRSRSRRRSPPRSPPSAPRFRPDSHPAPPPNFPPPHFPGGPHPPGAGIPAPPCPPSYQGPWPPPPPPMNYAPPPPSAYPPFPPGGHFPQAHMGQQQMPPGTHYFPQQSRSWQGGSGRGWHR